MKDRYLFIILTSASVHILKLFSVFFVRDNDYFLIINNDNQDEAFFCFEKTVRDGWTDLASDYQTIKEIEVEFEVNDRGNNKVVSLYAVREGDIIV